MRTKIYGASDDLIEIEGAISDEANVYLKTNERINFLVSDGTKGRIENDSEGIWRFEILSTGNKFLSKVLAVGEDAKHIGEASGCSSYSDVIILDEGVEWIKIGRKIFKP